MDDDKKNLCEQFTQAYELMQKGQLKEAREKFLAIQKQFPNDVPTKTLLERIKKEVLT